ncbi:LVIVD repeat-containing protein [Candidatus Lokiarchaeum ossiferum]|uniref:LVIVD repeat-containing protein n=1 Tax=Candidatus Lokiarchaeum ossiferum TaxID=2951803 RepID=UPI00352CF87E
MSKNNVTIRAKVSKSKIQFFFIGICLTLVLLNFGSLSKAFERDYLNIDSKNNDERRKNLSPTFEHVVESFEQNSDLFVVGNTAYISQFNGTIWIYDISDPIIPIELGSYQDRGGEPHGIYVENEILYCASWGSGLVLINVSDPTNPTKIGQYWGNRQSFNVVVDDYIAYIGNWESGLHIVNVSDPSNIILISQFSGPDYLIVNVVIHEKIAIITDIDENDGDLVFVNVSDPYNPVKLPYVYQGGVALDFIVQDDLLYLCDGDAGLVILNISSYDNIHVISSITSRKMQIVASLDFVNGTVYFLDYEEGLFIYDVSNPQYPKKLGSYSMHNANKIYVIGDYAYISSYAEGFIILDITTLGTSPIFIIAPSIIVGLAISGILLWKFKKK